MSWKALEQAKKVDFDKVFDYIAKTVPTFRNFDSNGVKSTSGVEAEKTTLLKR
jgi:hypothetical protein